VFVLLGNVVIQ